MPRFCWRERSEKLNWQLLSSFDVWNVVRRGDPTMLEPYALHVTFARLPAPSKDPQPRDAWFLVRVLQLSMEYLLFMRAKDGDVLKFLSQQLRQVETERDVLLLRSHKWKAKVRSGDEQVEKLHHVLQKITKLLQIHGASPSAVATIATLLTELVSQRRAKQKRQVLGEEDDDGDVMDEMLRPTEHEARVCGFCGKLFSSVEFLEKHLVKRHSGESIEVTTSVKQKVQRNFGEKKENMALPASAATMQKMVQRVERALQEHEEKLRSLVGEEAQKIKQMYEQLHAETKLAIECKTNQLKDELRHEEAQRQLNEVYLQKQQAKEELADLKKQIQFLTLKRKTMGAATNASLPTTLLCKSDDASVAAEIEINDLQHTLKAVNAELTASREELAKVQALHLSALRRKKKLADTLALSRGVSAAVQQDQNCQTEPPAAVINNAVQTDKLDSSQQSTSEVLIKSSAPILKEVGTDPLALSYEDVGIQTVDCLEPPRIDEEVQMDIIDDFTSALTRAVSPAVLEPISQESVTVKASQVAEDAVPPRPIVLEDDERISNYIHRVYRQDLLDIIADRAQSAASKAANNSLSPKKYSSIFRHKYVRSRFQHDEDLVKKREASCLLQLEQFARRFGVPAKSVWLSEDNVRILQQALHSHLEVLPTEVLTKMVDCENTINALIEQEWVPMEKTRLQALQRFKLETHANSESSQGLVRQAMTAFGTSMKAELPSCTVRSGNVVVAYAELISKKELRVSAELHDDNARDLSADSKMDSVMSARRYSAKNQLTVIVGEETISEGVTHVADDFEKSTFSLPTDNDD